MTHLNLDALIIPRFDAHMGEYISEYDARLHWATGFSGSAGACVITADKAVMFVDGRYTVQVQKECSPDIFEYRHLHDEFLDKWLSAEFVGGRVGLDPMFFSVDWYEKINLSLAKKPLGGQLSELVCISYAPIDALWLDRPTEPMSLAEAYPTQLAGRKVEDKISDITSILKANNVDYLVETQQDNIAWLLNIRGSDIKFNPFINSFLILHKNGDIDWFVNQQQIGNDLDFGSKNNVRICKKDQLISEVERLSGSSKIAMLDEKFSPSAVKLAANGHSKIQNNPITLLKAEKNTTELSGFRDCHIKDGVAWFRFGNWLVDQIQNNPDKKDEITEIEAQEKIQYFREQQKSFVYDSFNPISAAGSNGAMCHYKASKSSNLNLFNHNSFLLDSGAHYENGTTDATRSYVFGDVSKKYRQAYTSVLVGFIELARLKFPKGTQGHQIDGFARARLWQDGMDYDHGTGHGVGHFLSVHEFPQRIGKQINEVDLKAGMVLSIEPGFYEAGEFGIRIENLFEVVSMDNGFLGFRSLTMAPISMKPVDLDELTFSQKEWLNSYHLAVQNTLLPLIMSDEKEELLRQTMAI